MDITKANFESEVLKSDVPVLVDFWALWCGPCRMLSPVIEELGRELKNQAKVVKINVDEEPELASQFGIMSILTVIAFKEERLHPRLLVSEPKKTLRICC